MTLGEALRAWINQRAATITALNRLEREQDIIRWKDDNEYRQFLDALAIPRKGNNSDA